MRKATPIFILLIALLFIGLLSFPEPQTATHRNPAVLVTGEGKSLSRQERKRARDEYFNRMLRDPATGQIPPNIRQGELQHARSMPVARAGKSGSGLLSEWKEAGPTDVGGRTRALGIDVRNSDIIITGGVSGGIWKSDDGGQSWTLKTPAQMVSLTSVAQDPRPNHQNTWYAVSGEYARSSGYKGSGVYRSFDNGESWENIQPSPTGSSTSLISRVVVNPATGSVFITANYGGIYRSDDQGASFSQVLGDRAHRYSDIAAASNGHLLATLSSPIGSSQTASGVYLSTSNGDRWANITPADSTLYPGQPQRSVVAFAPSNPQTAYLFTNVSGDTSVRFQKVNLADTTFQDRTDNLPGLGGKSGDVHTQDNYNMALAVKPNNENFVVLGGRNLYRSRTGFSTPADSTKENWIGGYESAESYGNYSNHHPDQHALVFDPNDLNTLWSGHDGGLSLLPDVTTSQQPVGWVDKNSGYNVTQFYTVAIPNEAGDSRMMGGTQDNGTPFLYEAAPDSSFDASSGDGAYAYFGDQFAYTSSQEGHVYQLYYYNDGSTPYPGIKYPVRPTQLTGEPLFVHPYAIDPNDETVMFYPDDNKLWRNTKIDSIPYFVFDWQQPDSLAAPADYKISTLSFSQEPAHVLYYAAYAEYQYGETLRPPKLYRLAGADTAATGAVDISIPNADPGTYIQDIAINPDNADEILVAISSYNAISLFHSTDGGQTYTVVEGNLADTQSAPGPSVRTAAIAPADNGMVYVVGTSTGLYATSTLQGRSTRWELEAAGRIGNTIVVDLASRPSDGRVVAATHGRGLFTGSTSFINYPPSAVAVASPALGDTVAIEGQPSQQLAVKWNPSSDQESTTLNYEWQLSPSSSFNTVWFSQNTQTDTSAVVPYDTLASVLTNNRVATGSTIQLYQRVNTSDGVQTTTGTPAEITFLRGAITDTDQEKSLPTEFTLASNYPNPFNPSTTVAFTLPAASRVDLVVYDLQGRRVVQALKDAQQPAGRHTVSIDGSGLASGTYLYRLTARSLADGSVVFSDTQKMTLVK